MGGGGEEGEEEDEETHPWIWWESQKERDH
jgi:hypothetical protein